MDKYEEAVRKYHRSGAMLHIIGPPIGLAEVLQELAQFASWYEDKYLAEALTAAVEMRMHASYTDAMLEEKREKGTCGTCDNFSTIACPIVGFEKVVLLCRRYHHRRIVEVK